MYLTLIRRCLLYPKLLYTKLSLTRAVAVVDQVDLTPMWNRNRKQSPPPPPPLMSRVLFLHQRCMCDYVPIEHTTCMTSMKQVLIVFAFAFVLCAVCTHPLVAVIEVIALSNPTSILFVDELLQLFVPQRLASAALLKPFRWRVFLMCSLFTADGRSGRVAIAGRHGRGRTPAREKARLLPLRRQDQGDGSARA